MNDIEGHCETNNNNNYLLINNYNNFISNISIKVAFHLDDKRK